MAQRISKELYHTQATTYTKAALRDLNEKMKTSTFKRASYDEDEDNEDEYRKHKRRRVDKLDVMSLVQKENRLQDLLTREETKNHYMNLELSNALTDLEDAKIQLIQIQTLFSTKHKWVCILLLIAANWAYLYVGMMSPSWVMTIISVSLQIATNIVSTYIKTRVDNLNFYLKTKTND